MLCYYVVYIHRLRVSLHKQIISGHEIFLTEMISDFMDAAFEQNFV